MPNHKSVLLKMEVVRAGRARKCYHDPKKHRLRKGDVVLEVRVDMAVHGYCVQCAQEMLRIAQTKIAATERELLSVVQTGADDR